MLLLVLPEATAGEKARLVELPGRSDIRLEQSGVPKRGLWGIDVLIRITCQGTPLCTQFVVRRCSRAYLQDDGKKGRYSTRNIEKIRKRSKVYAGKGMLASSAVVQPRSGLKYLTVIKLHTAHAGLRACVLPKLNKWIECVLNEQVIR